MECFCRLQAGLLQLTTFRYRIHSGVLPFTHCSQTLLAQCGLLFRYNPVLSLTISAFLPSIIRCVLSPRHRRCRFSLCHIYEHVSRARVTREQTVAIAASRVINNTLWRFPFFLSSSLFLFFYVIPIYMRKYIKAHGERRERLCNSPPANSVALCRASSDVKKFPREFEKFDPDGVCVNTESRGFSCWLPRNCVRHWLVRANCSNVTRKKS